MTKNLNPYRFGGMFGTLSIDEKPFLNTFLDFTTYLAYKPTNAFHADCRGVYSCGKIINSSTIHKSHKKWDVIDGSVVNCLKPPVLYVFVLDELLGSKLFCEPEIIHYKN